MQRILIANPNVEQRMQICQHLANDKRLKIIESSNGLTTLKEYSKIQPNILVLDSYLKDINCIDIINRLSTNHINKKNCNIILTTKKDRNLNLSNVAKIYKIIYYNNENYLSDLSETINEMYLYGKYEELTTEDLDLFFLSLKIPLNSNGTDYIREAIFECYYYPDLQKSLKSIFSLIAERHNKSTEAIRSAFRTALERLNLYKESIEHPIMNYFDPDRDISPKNFLEIAVVYLHIIKRKNK